MTFALHDHRCRAVSTAEYRASIACGPLLTQVLDRLLGLSPRAPTSRSTASTTSRMVGDAVSAAAGGTSADGRLEVVATTGRRRPRAQLRAVRARRCGARAARRRPPRRRRPLRRRRQRGRGRAGRRAERLTLRIAPLTNRPAAASPARRARPVLDRRPTKRAQLRERAAQKPRDVHLRDADARRDLRLGQALLEAHRDDLALALGEVRRDRPASSRLAST